MDLDEIYYQQLPLHEIKQQQQEVLERTNRLLSFDMTQNA
jgi:hypothetical protein